MKTFKTFFLLFSLLGLLFLNIAANIQDVNATSTLYSAGNMIVNSHGEVIGCSCPVVAGDCVCALNAPDPGPAIPGI